MVNRRDGRHRYGQHYTPAEVARLLAAFAVRSATDLVFDPSCGDGRLLDSALRHKKSLAEGRSTKILARDLFGVDRDESAVELAAGTGARVACADFFDIDPGAPLGGSVRLPAFFDAVIGNPPYIRQEVMGAGDKRRIRQRLKQDCSSSPEIFWPRWSGRSDIYVYFFARSVRFLRPGGRLVFLTASSWLDAGYGAALREFLVENFRVVAVVESAAESFFADASINTAITVLERETDARARATNRVRFARLTRPLNEIPNNPHAALPEAAPLARLISDADRSVCADSYRIRVIGQAELSSGAVEGKRVTEPASSGWGKYLRAADVFFRVCERGSNRLKPLSRLARVRFGVKTGANDFFYLLNRNGSDSPDTNSASLRRLRDIASVRRGLTTGANEFFYLKKVGDVRAVAGRESTGQRLMVEDKIGARHLIESRYLSPVVFSLKEIPTILLTETRTKRQVFNCPAARAELGGTGALSYIESGERAGYHLRPTCAAREPWYSVARGRSPAPLLFPSKVGERWVIALNRAGVFEDKKLYGIFPREGVSAKVLAALLNSTWARYYAEVNCRQMTGAQAIADIDVAVAEQILLPDPNGLSEGMKRELEGALDVVAGRPVLSIFEEIKRDDRRRLDHAVLAAIGFDAAPERESALDHLYSAMAKIVRERISRSGVRHPALDA